MSVTPAGSPRDIFWRNVGLPNQAKRSGLLAAFAASSVLCFFWSVPTAFVSSLTEINSLKEAMPKLGNLIEAYPWLQKVFAQVAPLVLLLFNQTILPRALKYFATWEGHISSAMLEASLFVKLGCFMVRIGFDGSLLLIRLLN
jgi:calcium permeable stress-gated cation channel